MSIDGEETLLTGNVQPRDAKSVHELIAESGAPALLLDHFKNRLEYHEPWHSEREFSHLMRGLVDVSEANELLAAGGHGDLRLVDNGAIALMPRTASKAAAVEAHMRARGYAAQECIAVGDSREDVGVAPVVGRFFLVANGAEKDPSLRGAHVNVEVTEERNGEGFYEAVVRSLAERG
jgi:hydroxymethylpyrimidine pyrophosphatase-like HAD family hydrolase